MSLEKLWHVLNKSRRHRRMLVIRSEETVGLFCLES